MPSIVDLPVNKRTLPLFFMIDLSGSMEGSKISSVNNAMTVVLDKLREKEQQLRNIAFSLRIIIFNDDQASFLVGSRNAGVALEQFAWNDIPETSVMGGTPTGKAIDLMVTCMAREYLGGNIITPCLILISDGESDSRGGPFRAAVDSMKQNTYASISARSAIGIECTSTAKDELLYFVSQPENYVDSSVNPQNIVDSIVYATMHSITQASGQGGGGR